MTMSLKTHTAYPEIQVTEAFDWVLADRSGREDNPILIPKGAEFETVYPWEAKIMQQPAETFEEFTANGGTDPTVLTATTAASFSGTATSRQAAIDEAVALIASVQDEYLKEVA